MNRLPDLTDEQEAEIQRQIANDPDAPEATDAEIAEARPFAEALPALMESIRRARARPRVPSPKQAVTLRISAETLAKFQATGDNWRTRMSAVLDETQI